MTSADDTERGLGRSFAEISEACVPQFVGVL
jgi:hypothetical protein